MILNDRQMLMSILVEVDKMQTEAVMAAHRHIDEKQSIEHEINSIKESTHKILREAFQYLGRTQFLQATRKERML